MANKKTTAVDYFFDKIKSHFEHDGDLLESVTFLYAICKEMERNQTKQAYESGQEDEYAYHVNAVPRTDSETHYTETYGKESNHSEQVLEMERPRWVQFSERRPTESKNYFVKGKGDYGGYLFYFDSLGEFELGNLPVNKFSDEYLQWLEE
jgi:hypothetical protein